MFHLPVTVRARLPGERLPGRGSGLSLVHLHGLQVDRREKQYRRRRRAQVPRPHGEYREGLQGQEGPATLRTAQAEEGAPGGPSDRLRHGEQPVQPHVLLLDTDDARHRQVRGHHQVPRRRQLHPVRQRGQQNQSVRRERQVSESRHEAVLSMLEIKTLALYFGSSGRRNFVLH